MRHDNRDLAVSRESKVVDVYPFFDLMEKARSTRNHGIVMTARDSSLVVLEEENSLNKANYQCKIFKYRVTPQFLDNSYLMRVFTSNLTKIKAELKSFHQAYAAYYPDNDFDVASSHATTTTDVSKSLRYNRNGSWLKPTKCE